MLLDINLLKTIPEFNSWISAYERVIGDFQKIIDRQGTDAYLEQRLHNLNCVYADLLVNRINLVESEMDNHKKASYPL